jgi:hypothetical protein
MAISDDEATVLDDEDDHLDTTPLEPEDWQDWHSEELLNSWFSLVALAEAHYGTVGRATYHAWVEFVMHPEDWGLDNYSTGAGSRTWAILTAESDLLAGATYEQFENFVSYYY